ncbi:MAG TPA: LLM class flavin-dependent oxidoreductase [Streptosporangiales bacterium]
MTVEIGVILPTSTPDPEHPVLGDVRASARFAEGAGLDSVWSTDHLIASAPMLDSTVVLATAAAVTDRITIGFNVMLLALRPVAWAAKQITSLQYVSGGRLVVGVGTGNPAHGDAGWRAAGVPFGERGRRTDEALRVLRRLVAGEPVALDGAGELAIAPGSAVPPIYVAGDAPKALLRAARYGDGWATIAATPDQVAERVGRLRELAEREGRPAPGATVVGPALDTDDTGRAAEQLAAYAAAGTERVILAPTGRDWREDYEFAARVRESL